jgi:hypothetical protein
MYTLVMHTKLTRKLGTMDVQTQHIITTRRAEAASLITTGELNLAEEQYRYIVNTVQDHEGQEATYADRYNLSNVLVMQHKYAEAEPILRDALNYLAKRPVGDGSSNFLEQEDGTIKMLVQSLKGQGREKEADDLVATSHYGGREEQLQVRKKGYGLNG